MSDSNQPAAETEVNLSNEYDVRVQKYRNILERDGVVYKDKFDRTHTIAEARMLVDGGSARLCGRIISMRWFGKLLFAHIYDAGGEIQFSISKADLPEESFEFLKTNIDMGDYIGIAGTIYHTKKGELTLQASEYVILSKALRPLPEKYHGITDTDKKFRQRYLDVITSDEARNTMKARIKTLRYIRNYLDAAGFCEVETPILQNIASGAAARPFVTKHNALDAEFFLRISPELFLKQVIACGLDKVFELGRNFRNEGMDAMHLQEFTMLEWYAAYWDYKDNIKFIVKMMQDLVMEVCGNLQIVYEGTPLDFSAFHEVDYIAEINKAVSTDILSYDSADSLKNHIVSAGLYNAKEIEELKSIPAVVDFIFKRKLRPNIIQPTVVTNYPAFLIPLARRSDKDPRVIDMFQVIVYGAEVVKAYSELVNPLLQRETFEEQAQNKTAGDDEAFEVDESFLLAMEHGMPPMSGLGFGIDRFLSIITNQPTLRDVILFPQM
ncbi:MAG: lysine--tRNA ligase, partial [Chitinispirillia bacterium]|nr:lysine--tRNA ligase [Chitinispirillia bacterium]MCL2268338.1 lysine--tRNA ligase [Chitinispirillia bacterium]